METNSKEEGFHPVPEIYAKQEGADADFEETEQIPANKQVVLDSYEKEMPRLFQAASLVLSAEDKIEVPDNLWTYEQKAYFTENIFRELTGKIHGSFYPAAG